MKVKKKKIVVTQPLGMYPDQRERLQKMGDAVFYDTMPKDYDEWLERTKGADILCTQKFGFKQKVYELSNVFVSVPFIAVDWLDQDKLKEANIRVKNAPGCNKEPVAEWIVGMMINLVRKLPERINAQKIKNSSTQSVAGKKLLISGAGNIGTLVGEVCLSLHMDVTFFKRGDNLIEKAKNADIIIDALGAGEDTYGIYDAKFFQSLKKGAYFITVTSQKMWNVDAMIKALDQGILAGAATDVGGIQATDTREPLYRRLSKHPKILATAHVAFDNDRRNRVCNDMMIDNIETHLAGA